ncbi:hypothetical protein ACFL2R_02775 [Patescibacteria group bacterium]
MRSLKRRFEKVKKNNPFLSDYNCFTKAITGQGFSDKIIYFWFNKLVDKNDYFMKDKRELFCNFKKITKVPEGDIKMRQN